MSTKHKPATPLPWESSRNSSNPHNGSGWRDVLSTGAEFSPCYVGEGIEADAAYIAHAANAYPRLVEALRSLHDAYGKDSKSKAAALVGTRHLLRELGEE